MLAIGELTLMIVKVQFIYKIASSIRLAMPLAEKSFDSAKNVNQH